MLISRQPNISCQRTTRHGPRVVNTDNARPRVLYSLIVSMTVPIVPGKVEAGRNDRPASGPSLPNTSMFRVCDAAKPPASFGRPISLGAILAARDSINFQAGDGDEGEQRRADPESRDHFNFVFSLE